MGGFNKIAQSKVNVEKDILMDRYITTEKTKIKIGSIYIAIMLSLIPLFNYNIGGRGLFLYLGIGLVAISVLLPHSLVVGHTYALYLLFIFYDLMTFMWAHDDSDLFQYVKLIFFMLFVIFVVYNEREIRLIWAFQIVLGIVVAFILVSTSNTMVAEGQYLTDTQRAILVVGGVQIDPNYAAMLMFPVGILACKLLVENKIKLGFKVVAGIFFVLTFYALLRSGTRGGLIAFAIGCLFYFFKKRGSTFKKIIVAIIAVIAGVIIIPRLLLLLPDSITRRFTLSYILDNGGAGRSEYWITCLEHLWDTPLTFMFGHGKQATIELLGLASHNYFIDAIYNGGIVEFLLLVSFYISLFRRAADNENVYAESLLVTYIAMSMTVSVGSNIYFWVGMIVIMLISQLPEFEFGGLNQ